MAKPITNVAPSTAKRRGPARKSLYERDPYAWSIEQARLLREKRFDKIDVENVADEILSVGKQELHMLEEDLIALLQHILVWDHQPDQPSRKMEGAIADHRSRVEDRIKDNPSLNACLNDAVQWSFGIARLRASSEMDVDLVHLPESCPYDWEAIMARPFERSSSAPAHR